MVGICGGGGYDVVNTGDKYYYTDDYPTYMEAYISKLPLMCLNANRLVFVKNPIGTLVYWHWIFT